MLGERRESLAELLRSQVAQDFAVRNAGVEVIAVLIEAIHPPAGAAAAYHAVPEGRVKEFLGRVDHAAIYLMIAGSATAIAGPLLRGWFRAVILTGQWAFAVVGICALWLLPKPHHAVMVGLACS